MPVLPSALSVRHLRRSAAVVAAAAGTLAAVALVPAAPALAAPGDAPAPQQTVSADGLPTVQINGVAWSQVVVGNTVYVAGSFSTARPAGSAPGTNEVPRENLLAYDITTGALIQSFHHVLNAEATNIAASPDGTRLYVGGKFTSVDGTPRYRLAAFDIASGNLITGFKPIPNASVGALAVTNSTVYFGGAFGNVNGVARTRAAAVDITGALLPWAPTVDNYGINAMIVTPDGSGVVLGGRFSSVNGAPAFGSAAVDAVTGANRAWALNQSIKGSNTAGTLTLNTDGTLIYGGNYTYGNGNFEGTWAADPTTGAIVWANDCLGDTYSVMPVGGIVYASSHAHNCSAMGAFPETNPRSYSFALAYSTTPSATNYNVKDAYGNDFSAFHTSTMLQWFPKLTVGTYSGQAGWSVSGNADYIVFGGEFPTVNNVAQQGLVRFPVHRISPNAFGPAAPGTPTTSVTDNGNGTATVAVTTRGAYDRDDAVLRYDLQRGPTLVASTTAPVTGFWTTQPNVSISDTTAPLNSSITYKIVATDSGGRRSSQTFTVSTSVPQWQPTAGAVSSGSSGQAAIGSTTLAGRVLTVPFNATGQWWMPSPSGSCLKSGATTVNPTSIALTTNQWGNYAGTATYTLPTSGTYGFDYGCRTDFSTATIGTASIPGA